MPRVRLIGLVLFITTIFLAMSAAATQTTHIRFKQQAGNVDAVQFTAVPVIYPLLASGTLGLLMWFVPTTLTTARPQRRRRQKHAKRR